MRSKSVFPLPIISIFNKMHFLGKMMINFTTYIVISIWIIGLCLGQIDNQGMYFLFLQDKEQIIGLR